MSLIEKCLSVFRGIAASTQSADSNATLPDGQRSAAEIQTWMQEQIGSLLDVKGETLDPTAPLTSYGLDSIAGFTLTLDLAEWLERDLPASLLWEYPTIAELAEFLSVEVYS